MAQYRDRIPEDENWVHELAKADVHPEAEKLLQLGRGLDPQQIIEESTIRFLSELRDRFSYYTRLFNGYSDGGVRFTEVKIYSVAQTPADFMVFRNQIKLVISNSAQGVIQIGFDRHDRSTYAVDGRNTGASGEVPSLGFTKAEELLAQIGPFRSIHWVYQGEQVQPEEVARYFFAEFVRASRDQKKSKLGNQLLVEQIKSLLKEKGLDL